MGNRWQTHGVLAWLIRAAIFVAPIVTGLIISYQVAVRLTDGDTVASILLWWTAVIGSALLSAYVVDRMLRWLVPVTTLLRLSLAFPDKAPSRFAVMMRSFTTRGIGRRLATGELDHLPVERSASAELLSLLASLAAHDPQTRGHAERVRAYCDLVGEELGLGQGERDRLRWGALLHDIGKVAVPASLLNKPETLNESEWEVLRAHPTKGDELISGLHDWLGDWRMTVVQHHERWDGTGYPLGLSGREIALGGRIVSVCDAFDAMTSVRAYGERLSAEEARTEIARVSGDQFDPMVVRALMRVSIGRLRAPLGVWAWLPAFTVPGAIERLGKHTSVVAAALLVLVGASALAADQVTAPIPEPEQIEVAGISIEPSDVPLDATGGLSVSAESGAEAAARAPAKDQMPDEASPAGPVPRAEPEPSSAPPTAADAGATAPPETVPTTTTSTSPPTTTTTAPTVTPTTVAPTTTTTVPPTMTTTAPAPPVVPIAPALTIAVDEDVEATFLLNATGVTELVSPPSGGLAAVDAEGSGWYRPDPDANGVDSFTYRACIDDDCVVGVVSVEIAAVNDAPVAFPDVAAVSSDGTVTILVLDNDQDVDGDQLTVTAVGTPDFGQASTDGAVVEFDPLGEWGDVSLDYTACDPVGACSSSVVQITVSQAETAGAADDTFVVSDSKPTGLDVLSNDENGPEPITVSIVEAPAGGSVQVLGNGTILFKPQGFTGTSSFVYQVCDAGGGCSQATVTLTVE